MGWQILAFLKKDMNLKLIFLILALIIAIAGFSIFYQNKFKGISTDYENKTQQLEKITAKAVSEEAKVQEISQQQENIKQDKEALESRYNEITSENQALKKDLDSIRLELEKTKSELADKTSMFNLLQTRFDQVEGSLIKANDEISMLSAKVKELCSELESAGKSNDEC